MLGSRESAKLLPSHPVESWQAAAICNRVRMMIMSTVFDDAISAHTSWVTRFGNSMRGIDRESFDPEQIRDDTICEFGRWLHANATLFLDIERYEQLNRLHQSFHEEAAEIAAMLGQNARPRTLQARLVGLSGLSGQLVRAIKDAADDHAAVP